MGKILSKMGLNPDRNHKKDFLLELANLNCHHIIDNILLHLGVIGLARAFDASPTWRHLVESLVSRKFSQEQQHCFRWMLSLSRRSFPKNCIIKEKDMKEMTILHLSAKCGFRDALEFFHQEVIPEYDMVMESETIPGTNNDLPDFDLDLMVEPKKTVAYYACVGGHLDTIIWLDQVFSTGDSIFFGQFPKYHLGLLAVEHGHLHILKHIHKWCPGDLFFLIETRQGGDLVREAVYNGHLNVTAWLLETFPDRWNRWMGGFKSKSTLFEAALKGHLDILKYFHSRFPNQLDEDFTSPLIEEQQDQQTMIFRAANSGQLDVVKWLLDTFPGRWNLSALEPDGNQIMFTVIRESGSIDVLEFLYEHREIHHLDFLRRDNNGLTLLYHAVSYNDANVVRWLLERFPQLWNDYQVRSNASLLYTQDIFHLAIMGYHLEALKAIHDVRGNFDDIVPTDGERQAILDSFEWEEHSPSLMRRTFGKCATNAVDGAATASM